MNAGKHFSQEQKLVILLSAEEVGVKEAAKLAGIHYTTVYEWRKKLEALGEKSFLFYSSRLVMRHGPGFLLYQDYWDYWDY